MQFLSAAYLLISLLLLQAPSEPKTADEIMQRVRQTTQLSKSKIPATGLQLTGQGTYAGMPARFSLLFNKDGHFLQSTSSRINTASGYDGNTAWVKDLGGEQRIQDLTDGKSTIFSGLLTTNLWIVPESGMTYSIKEPAGDGKVILIFKHEPTEKAGTITIDTRTWLPLECTMTIEGRQITTRWSGRLDFQGMKFPKSIQSLSSTDRVETIHFDTVQAAPTFVRNPFAPVLTPPTDVTFDNTLPAELEVKRATTGHLLVKPKINGKEVGWFILDSGAGANVLDVKVVKELGLEQFGNLPAVGVGGAVKTYFCKPETITLGRATFKEPIAIGLDLSFLSGPMGAKIAGVVGYSTFHRCIIEMDTSKATVSLYDPQNYDQARVQNHWQKLYQIGRVSSVEAEFEGHKGVFKLDTGAAGSNVAIHAPIVEKFKLLVGRDTEDTMTGGVGGMVKSKKGTLKYFEIGGHRMDNIEATFAITDKGAFNSADTLGNIGGDLLRPFKMVFDYQNKRIAFIKRD